MNINSHTRSVGQFHRANDQITIEKCAPHNLIVRMGN